jgi:hypothetical protein
MKKLLLICGIMMLVALGAFAQVDYSVYEESFQDFSDEVAASLPFNAAIGLNWADGYIGQFPHFGVGVTVGATSIPYEIMEPVFDMLDGFALPSDLDFIEKWGAPLPAWSLDARLGGFILPFDVGVKFGFIPDEAKVLMPFQMDYLLVGGDVRLALLKGKGLMPDLSVGAGYTYLEGAVYLEDLVAGDQVIDIYSIVDPLYTNGSYAELIITSPDVYFDWQAHVIDLKVQASKKLVVITPNIGLGVSYGLSKAGGGLESSLTFDTDITTPSAPTLSDIQALFESLGYAVPTSTGLAIASQEVEGLAVRAFGGIGFNLWVLKIDLSGMYNFTSGSYGVALNTRIQL